MALKTNALISLQEAKDWLTITGSADDVKLEDEVNRASEALEAYCNRPLKSATYTAVRMAGPCSPTLYLKATPINIASTLTVSVNGTAQTVWKQESDGDPATFNVLVGSDDHTTVLGQRNHLWRSLGWCATTTKSPMNVLLTYTGGLSPVPDDLKGACFFVLQKLWRDRQRGLSDVQTVTMPSGSVTILDIPMPRWAREALLRYRVVPV
jgi:gp6-like head-tail connector protein